MSVTKDASLLLDRSLLDVLGLKYREDRICQKHLNDASAEGAEYAL